MSVIASTDINNENDDVLFDRKTLEKLKAIDIEELDYDHSSDEENVDGAIDPVDGGLLKHKSGRRSKYDEAGGNEEGKSSDEDENVKRIDQMADEIDTYYKQKKDYKIDLDRKLAKKEKKRKALIESQRLKKHDESEEEELNNDDVRDKKVHFKTATTDLEGDEDDLSDVEMKEPAAEVDSDDDGGFFLNPLLLNNKKDKKPRKAKLDDDDVSEGEWSSEEDEKKKDNAKKEAKNKNKKDTQLGKRKKREGEEDATDFFTNQEIEEVP